MIPRSHKIDIALIKAGDFAEDFRAIRRGSVDPMVMGNGRRQSVSSELLEMTISNKIQESESKEKISKSFDQKLSGNFYYFVSSNAIAFQFTRFPTPRGRRPSPAASPRFPRLSFVSVRSTFLST